MARRHRRTFLTSVTGAAVYAVGLVATSFLIGNLTDEVLIPGFEDGEVALSAVLSGCGVIVAVVLVRSVGVVFRRYFGAKTARLNQVDLRDAIADRYLEVPLAYHRNHPTGELLAHADADVEVATEALHPLPLTTSVVVLAFVSLGALLWIDPWFAVVGLVTFPLVFLVNRVYTKRVEGPAAEVQHQVGVVSSIAHESFDGALVIKTLGREDDEVRRLADKSRALLDARLQVGRLRANFEPLIDQIPNLGIIALVAIGGWRVSVGAMSEGDLVTAAILFNTLGFPMRVLGFFLEEVPRSVVAHDRIERLLRAEIGPPRPHEPRWLPDQPLSVRFDDVWFDHGDGPVLEGMSFEIAEGETVAIVGQTGGGKSTVCQLVGRLADPDRGSVSVGGIDLRAVDADDIHRAVAIVFQESFLFAASVAENISLGAGGVDERAVVDAAAAARADGFIRQTPNGYETIVGERGVTLSGGQRQRVALARALVRRPRVLVLDDATSAVDPVIESEILAGLRAERSTTMLIVAHRVSTIALADRVLFVQDGKVAAMGTHTELLANPAYAALARAYEEGEAVPMTSEDR
ncbi:MAG: ABC transporter ATP-binding protein [Actinomycetota bacterium]|nr:ABC transporter ATP-binding protein [Actinomycetota bacterium]